MKLLTKVGTKPSYALKIFFCMIIKYNIIIKSSLFNKCINNIYAILFS